MSTQAELTSVKLMLRTMKTKDLAWQVSNNKMLKLPADVHKLFADELKRRRTPTPKPVAFENYLNAAFTKGRQR